MSVLIAGAGLGGLTLGAMLQAQGQSFRIFEAAEAFDLPEIGMLLRPEAMMLLDRLGLGRELEEIGIPLRQVAWYDG
ncbi:flavin-dependent oxidoreductase, partial [Thioclava sp. BHET1]